jgi:hypothetical protein
MHVNQVHLPIELACDVLDLLTEANSTAAAFGDCSSRMDPTGKFCTVCAVTDQFQAAIWAAQEQEERQ